MSLIRFKMPNDVDDLSIMFAPIGLGPMYATPTGFIDPNTGKDLREIFAVNTTDTIPEDTKLIAQNGIDLRYIFQGIPIAVTIGGSGTYTQNITGNKYTYTFSAATGQNLISINKNIPELHAIVVGGGGPGNAGTQTYIGGGGAGGGFGYLILSYLRGTIYTITSAAKSSVTGQSSSFTTSGIGVISTGGSRGASTIPQVRPLSGTSTSNGPGTFVSFTGGRGGIIGNPSGENSSGSITVLGVTYNFGGGGRAGTTNPNLGGNAGVNGIGGTGITATKNGDSGTTPGSGGGGGGQSLLGTIGSGGPGLIIITFTYP
jgi:hypothetical protein